jgi:hypothetical protein
MNITYHLYKKAAFTANLTPVIVAIHITYLKREKNFLNIRTTKLKKWTLKIICAEIKNGLNRIYFGNSKGYTEKVIITNLPIRSLFNGVKH